MQSITWALLLPRHAGFNRREKEAMTFTKFALLSGSALLAGALMVAPASAQQACDINGAAQAPPASAGAPRV